MNSPMRNLGWQWLAGLYEGEGTCHRTKKGYWRLVIVSTDFDVIDSVQKIAGGHVSKPRMAKMSTKPFKRWELSTQSEILPVLEKLLPYLHERRAATARDAIFELRLSTIERCRNGHIRTPKNTQVRSNGIRRCRECNNESQRRRANAA